jgi:cell division septation protein DedD
MNYEFSLDGKKIIGVVLSCIALGILFFMAGWLTGAAVRMPKSAIQPVGAKSQEAVPEEKPGEVPVAAVKKPMPEKPEVKPDDTAEKAEPAPPEGTAEKPPEGMLFSVQVGAFKDRKQAEPLLAELKGKGHEPYIFEFTDDNKQKWYALRIGDFKDEEGANKAALAFKEKEKKPALVTKIDTVALETEAGEPPKEEAEKEKPETPAGDEQGEKESEPAEPGGPGAGQGVAYSVQVGSFVVEKNARKMAEDLKTKKYKASVLTMRDSKNKLWYVVQIGDFAAMDKASRAAGEFTKKEEIVAVVIPIDARLLEERKKPSSTPGAAESEGVPKEAGAGEETEKK